MSGYTDDCYFVPDSNDHGAIMEDKEEEERAWTNTDIDAVALRHLPNIDMEKSPGRPILISTWLSKNYILMKSDGCATTPLSPRSTRRPTSARSARRRAATPCTTTTAPP